MSGRPLTVLHVLRAPVGGLFRHVVDLTRGQAARGHRVGIVADSTTGGAGAEAILESLHRELTLGVSRVPMSRHLGASDVAAWRHVGQRAGEVGAEVVHGHGAKGGAYARLIRGRAIRVYTPHGGTLNFDPRTPLGMLYLTLERLLMRRTELFLFESVHARDVFRNRVGSPAAIMRVVHNGVTVQEFVPVEPGAQPTDIVFVGELRTLKGVDVLIEAIGTLAQKGRRVTATIVGHGPDAAAFRERANACGITDAVHFAGTLPARQAFTLGRTLVVPSRAESLPYIVLEAAAAGIPILATHVGGIPEIFGPQSASLLPPGNAAALAEAIRATLADPAGAAAAAEILKARVRADFSAETMTENVLAAYRAGIEQKNGALLPSP